MHSGKGTPHQGLYWLRSGVALAYKTKDDGNYELAAPIYRGVWTGPSLVIGVHAISQRAMTKCEVDWIAPVPPR